MDDASTLDFSMNQQLALAIQLNDEATFTDFNWSNNALLHAHIEQTLHDKGERLIYIWGVPGSGKSHVLQACCQQYAHGAIYLPLAILKTWGPDVFEGLDTQALLCVDDVDAIATDASWEEALFHLYNRIRDAGCSTLIMTGQQAPRYSPIKLPDLRSRLGGGLVMQLHELNDDAKVEALQLQAQKRGLELPTSVGQYLVSRCARNMHDLHALLNRLDQASWVAQRKLTIPFVKSILTI